MSSVGKIPDPPPLGAQGIASIILLVISLTLMGGDWVKPDVNFTALLALFIAARFITVREGTAGYGNNGLLSVMSLFAVAEGISQTGGLARVIAWTTGRASTSGEVLIRMFIPIMFASAFINNTPIVALMIPIVLSWARRNSKSPKPMLICLSYSAILGGTCTMIGTSTNLVVSGFFDARYKVQGSDVTSIGIFDIAPYGIAYAAWGFAFMVMFSSTLLKGTSSNTPKEELLVRLVVPKGSGVAGQSVRVAGLRSLDGLFLVSVTRRDETIHAVGPELVLQEFDILSLAGDLTKVSPLSTRLKLPIVDSELDDPWEVERGLSPGALQDTTSGSPKSSSSSKNQLLEHSDSRLLQMTVKMDAPLLGKRIREIGFRSRFNAGVVAVKRPTKVRSALKTRFVSKQVEGKLPDIVLEAGDELLVDAGSDFQIDAHEISENFESVSWLDRASSLEFMTGYNVPKGSSIAGKSILEAGLSGFQGISLVKLERADGTVMQNVPPSTLLEVEDTLYFYSDVEGLTFLFNFDGMHNSQKAQIKKAGVNTMERRLVQVVVATHSPLIGRSVRDSRFRTKYNAAIVGVHRRGERINQKIGDIVLQSGDLLLLDAGDRFMENHDTNAFSLISEVPKSAPKKTSRMWYALALMVAMITVQVVQSFTSPSEEYINLWPAATLTYMLMIAIRCMTWNQALASFDWTVYLTIAASFGITSAMSNTGVAGNIAWVFIQLGVKIGGRAGILSCVYIVTALLSEILTNNAAAALMYPIASIAGDALNVDPKLMAYTIMLGASSSFISPFGYQCNLMVFNAGNMVPKDLARVGVPFQVWMWIGATLVLGADLNIMLGVSLALLVVVCVGVLCWDRLLIWWSRRARLTLPQAELKSKMSDPDLAAKTFTRQ